MKRELHPVGFFSECFGGAEGPSLVAAARSKPRPEEDKLGAYLDQGKVFACITGKARDVLSPDRRVAGRGDLHILTDGVWAWPAFLAYYVVKYHIDLPTELWDHARRNNWAVSSDLDVSALTLS